MTIKSKLQKVEATDASGVAAMLGVGRHTVSRWHKNGLIPDPVMIGGVRRWRCQEIREWLIAGAPHRSDWRWYPTGAWSLTEYCTRKHAELRTLEGKIADATLELERLETR